MIRKPLFATALGISLALTHPALAGQVRDSEMETLTGRLFPALSALRGVVLEKGGGPKLATLLAERRRRWRACQGEPACSLEAARWSPSDIEALADAAGRLPPDQAQPPPPDGLHAQVVRELQGLDSILAVYGRGGAPRYPQIDGPGLDADSREFKTRVAAAIAIAGAEVEDQDGAFDTSVDLAAALLDVNERDDAARFEPLDARFNAPALERTRTLDWSRYPYTAIIVPGEGPEDLTTTLSAPGKYRIRLAAERYFAGAAPFIILTGGAVHPRGARYVEGKEMRDALVERYGVPQDAVIVEPYARHTTTNLRNAARRLFALKAPVDRDALIVTDPNQSRYIEGSVFRERNLKELGYQPGAVGRRLSPFELVFRPSSMSAIVDPLDPLDP